MHPIIAKLWIGITILIIIIPIGMVLFNLYKRSKYFLNKRANKLEQQKEIAEVKETLEENQDEFITSNEYWSFSSPETSNEEVQNIEEEKEENSEVLEEKSEDNSEVSIWEKERKRLETILLEAEHLKGMEKSKNTNKNSLKDWVLIQNLLKYWNHFLSSILH